MPRLEDSPLRRSVWPVGASLLPALTAVVAGSAAAAPEPQAHRYVAPIEIVKPAPFVELALPPAAYAHTLQADLRDLRVVDGAGERVPFAILAPPAAAATERVREAALYRLPQRPAGSSTWPSPVDVVVDGDRISVRRSAAGTAAASGAAHTSPGWLIDLGERAASEPAPRRLQLRWSGPAEFSAAYALQTSADLRSWRNAPGGQVMALQSPSGTLAQPTVELPDRPGRFVRLTWFEPASAPLLTGAASIAEAAAGPELAAANEVLLAPIAAPASAAGRADEPRGALQFDLGGDLPLAYVNLRLAAAGTRIAPVRIQGRRHTSDPWRELASGVFYRIERDGVATEAPALPLSTRTRHLRIVPDERAAALDPAQTRLVVHARLASLVFAPTGAPPFRLRAGSADAPAGALPAATLVPQLDEERKRFGQARLGAFAEVPEAAMAAEQAARLARLRPWLLWGVLLVGVSGLALLVWRLARTGRTPPPPAA